jgi:hypothetical protein
VGEGSLAILKGGDKPSVCDAIERPGSLGRWRAIQKLSLSMAWHWWRLMENADPEFVGPLLKLINVV